MPGIPFLEEIKRALSTNMFGNTPEGGQGLLSPQNIGAVAQAPAAGMGDVPTGANPLLDVMRGPTQQATPAPQLDPQILQQAVQGIQGIQSPQLAFPGSLGMGLGMAQNLLPSQQQSPVQEQEKPKAPPKEEKKEEGGLDIMKLLTQLGIPLATAGVGMGVPGALAGAAGFQTGFTGEQSRQRKASEGAAAEQAKTEQEFQNQVKLEEKKSQFSQQVQSMKLAGETVIKNIDEIVKFAPFGQRGKFGAELIEMALSQGMVANVANQRVTEKALKETMEKHSMTREQVLEELVGLVKE